MSTVAENKAELEKLLPDWAVDQVTTVLGDLLIHEPIAYEHAGGYEDQMNYIVLLDRTNNKLICCGVGYYDECQGDLEDSGIEEIDLSTDYTTVLEAVDSLFCFMAWNRPTIYLKKQLINNHLKNIFSGLVENFVIFTPLSAFEIYNDEETVETLLPEYASYFDKIWKFIEESNLLIGGFTPKARYVHSFSGNPEHVEELKKWIISSGLDDCIDIRKDMRNLS